MQVVSDTHVRADRDHLFTRHFRKALEDIAAVSPDSIGVFVVGDLTDGGTDAEYETSLALVRDFGSRLPPFHAVAGNHDLTGPLGRFLQAKEDGLLLVRGRDFDGGLWLPSAQFIVEPATHGWRPATVFGSPAATPRSARCRSRSASRSICPRRRPWSRTSPSPSGWPDAARGLPLAGRLLGRRKVVPVPVAALAEDVVGVEREGDGERRAGFGTWPLRRTGVVREAFTMA